MQKIYISDFHLIRPEFEGSQTESIQFLADLRLLLNPELNREEVEAKVQKYGKANEKILKRGTEVPDFIERSKSLMFQKDNIADLTKRMEFFKDKAISVFNRWYGSEYKSPKPDHLVHVTCTGYIAPNAAHSIASQWANENHNTQVTNAYHMGCYASLPALRIAKGLALSSHKNIVDIAHTEMCSLHFDPTTLATEQIIVQSLFADGHIKYRLSNQKPKLGFEVAALNEKVLPESLEKMTWVPHSQAFAMTLSRDIPITVAPHLESFVTELLKAANADTTKPIYYAIHPGGPKIIEGVEMMLDLSEEQAKESHEILANYGNMSSATLPHIWDLLLKNEERMDGAAVVSLGFGPGLTMSGAVFKICRN